MEKLKIEIKEPKVKKLEYNGVEIDVKPFLDAGFQAALTSQYIEELFSTEKSKVIPRLDSHYFDAEVNQMVFILEYATNIDTAEINYTLFYDSQLWEDIKKLISNYGSFRTLLKEVVEDTYKRKSLATYAVKVIDEAKGFLENILSADPEELKKLQEESFRLLDELKESSIVKDMERAE